MRSPRSRAWEGAKGQSQLNLARSVQDKLATLLALHQIGQIHLSTGNAEHSLAFIDQALEISRSLGNRLGEGLALKLSALARASMGDYDSAESLLRRSLELVRSVGDRSAEADVRYQLARLERDAGRLPSARKMMDAALAIAEGVRSQVESQDLRSSFLASKRDYHDLQIDVLMRLDELEPGRGHSAAALQLSEQARARSHLDLLIESGIDIRSGVDPALLEREKSLQRQINAKERFRARSAAESRRQHLAAKAARELEDLLREYRDLQGKIRSASPRYADLTQARPLEVHQLRRQLLDEEDVLLEYFLGEDRSHLWVLKADSLKHFPLPPAREIEEAARRAYELYTSSHRRAARRAALRAAEDLSRMILGPAWPHLDRNRLIVVGDGPLLYVPFAALPLPSDRHGQGRFLVEAHEIVTLPSASALAQQRRRGSSSDRPRVAAIFADPVFAANDDRLDRRRAGQDLAAKDEASFELSELGRSARETDTKILERLPHTRSEAEAIASLAGQDQASVALDFAASREAVLNSDLSAYRILHFATHGLLNSRHPELSGIVLSLIDEQGRPQDGFLRSHQIYNLELNADLVVLSACSTALGKVVRGEGLLNLTRAFAYAGAASVLASLWDVRDEATAQLMLHFYRSVLQEGLTPPATLRAAQRKLLAIPRWQAPYYWAGFVLQGDWRGSHARRSPGKEKRLF